MLYISVPTREEFLQLAEMRSDACVSIYLKTSPLPQEVAASRIELRNLVQEAFKRLSLDKQRQEALEDEITGLLEADDFWSFHANGLVILATPDCIRTYRIANDIKTQIEVSNRFYLKPLLRALTFPHTAYVLALSENSVRLVEFFPVAPPEEVSVPGLPKDATSAVKKSSLTASLDGMTHESGSRGKKMRLAQYVRKIDEAPRPVLLHSDSPLILVSTEPLASIYRSMASVQNLVAETIFTSPDRLSISELVALARPVLDTHYARQLHDIKDLFELRAGQKRVVTDLADTAKAATYGMVDLMLVDFDLAVTGSIDEGGKLAFSDAPGSYGVADELVKRALAGGGKVLAVRKEEMIGNTGIAAVLRYPL